MVRRNSSEDEAASVQLSRSEDRRRGRRRCCRTLENAKLLAGGQSLMPMLNFRFVQPDHIIDLNRVEGLAYIREHAGRHGGRRDDAPARPRILRRWSRRFPLMHEAIRNIGHRQTRNRGTIGGSLCHLDPSAELVSCAMTLDATRGGRRGRRASARSRSRNFPVAYLTSAVEPDEVLTAIRFTAWPAGHGYAFVEFARRHGDFAIVSAAVLLDGRRRRQDHPRGGDARRHGDGAGARARIGSGAGRQGAGRRRFCARPARAAAPSRRSTTCTRRRLTASISPP